MEKLQFLYQLKLIPSLLEEANWTDQENNIVQKHFEELQHLKAIGKLILAGRTLEMDSSGFGIVILEVDSEDEARTLMENDPAVKEGIMTATLFPYRVALIRD
ncbi:YciI family protein [Paenisporosarcina quisquiliarum]|uniref:YciI family protein n=1 Tax=Paenisporosarcina quisquiliarum TaxID=365346 RepID=A0A9X3REP5_9BACL|nr:YciI family protein [Paenisporosarcina quisquiliarum]MCZ8537797.1 YciI family protein [Paenisporosarcina quisquiliarum]